MLHSCIHRHSHAEVHAAFTDNFLARTLHTTAYLLFRRIVETLFIALNEQQDRQQQEAAEAAAAAELAGASANGDAQGDARAGSQPAAAQPSAAAQPPASSVNAGAQENGSRLPSSETHVTDVAAVVESVDMADEIWLQLMGFFVRSMKHSSTSWGMLTLPASQVSAARSKDPEGVV